MSNQCAIGLILVAFPVNMAIYHAVDRWFQRETEAIATEVNRGVASSLPYRWMQLRVSWFGVVGRQIALLVLLSARWLFFGRSTGDEDVRLLAFACAFLAFVGAVGWAIVCPFWYAHLASILRQAEADRPPCDLNPQACTVRSPGRFDALAVVNFSHGRIGENYVE